jgi:hypothetical protein
VVEEEAAVVAEEAAVATVEAAVAAEDTWAVEAAATEAAAVDDTKPHSGNTFYHQFTR